MRALRSLLAARRPMATSDALQPWLSPEELAQITAVFAALGPRRVLEWGAGGSTAHFLVRFSGIEQYVSVEHDQLWAKRVAEAVDDPRLSLVHCGPDRPPAPWPAEERARKAAEKAWHELCERDPEVMRSYVETPRRFGPGFDLALVDGRARVYCLLEAWQLVRDGGAIVIHDAQRELYHPTLRELGTPHFLEPWTQGQVCVLHRRPGPRRDPLATSSSPAP